MEQFDNVSVATRASVYFDGKCVSHAVTLADGSRKSVGVILPATLVFNTGAPEVMQIVAGNCEVTLASEREARRYHAGQSFSVPGDSSFTITASEPVHYICHFG